MFVNKINNWVQTTELLKMISLLPRLCINVQSFVNVSVVSLGSVQWNPFVFKAQHKDAMAHVDGL